MNKLRHASQLLVAGALMAAAACSSPHYVINSEPQSVRGNGRVVDESRSVGGFSGVELGGYGNLYVTQGAREELTIRAEENLLQYLKAEVRGGTLLIWKESVTLLNTQPIEYHLTVDDLDRVALTGVGSIEGSSLRTGALTVRMTGVGSIDLHDLTASSLDLGSSGLGDVTLSGTLQNQTILLSGLGNYVGRELASATADVTITNGGSATVRVRDRLRATIRGSGNVYYIGNPTVESSISGSGRVEQVGG